jgi:alginate O-acetyltransferase complex protein AlgI
MLFTEFHFIFLFVPLTLLAFELAPTTNQKLVILTLASLVFYAGWDPKFLPMLLISLAANYGFSRALERTKSKWLLAAAVTINLIPIAYFKYSGMFAGLVTAKAQTGLFHEKLGSLLPIGISFYTFQQIAYLVDIYTGKFKPTDGLRFVFCTTFFPHLVAGPIVQFKDLVPQLDRPVDRSTRFLEGLLYFATGFIKKYFVADTFASFSDPIFSAPGDMHFERSMIAMLGYTFQIYFDFSGYSDMALGLARLFGWQLPLNFDSPYKSFSIIEFWRRWHMTLSGFLRDYVYIALGGNRGTGVQRYKNLLLTMLIGGLWHGAAWTFVVWGGLHGLALAINTFWNRHVGLRLGALGWLITFITVALLWVLFRATSFASALEIYSGFLYFKGFSDPKFWALTAAGFGLIALPNSHALVRAASSQWFENWNFDVSGLCRRIGAYAALSWGVLALLSFAFYAGGIDRLVYKQMRFNDVLGVSRHDAGDFRSALWSKHLLSTQGKRIAIAGSSFANGMGAFKYSRDGRVWNSESFGMGGNGLLNAARTAIQLSTTHSVDVIVLALSPLNFGVTLESGPFPGQCLEGLDTITQEPKADLWGGCEGRELRESELLAPALLPFNASGYQFRHFIRKISLARLGPAPLAGELDLSPEAAETRLKEIMDDIASKSNSLTPVSTLKNGADRKFGWMKRNIFSSLDETGKGFAYLAAIKAAADRHNIRVFAYETPTVSNETMPTIYPKGFFPAYQTSLRSALARLDIPYLDLSGLFPWTGTLMADFVHALPRVRPLLHEILLYSLFQPEKLKASGLLPASAFDPAWSGL